MDLRFDHSQLAQMALELDIVQKERDHCIVVIASMAMKLGQPCGYVLENEGYRIVVDMPYGQLSWFVSADTWERYSLLHQLPVYEGPLDPIEPDDPIPPALLS